MPDLWHPLSDAVATEEAEVGGSRAVAGLLWSVATRWRCAFTFLQLDSARNETSGNSTHSGKCRQWWRDRGRGAQAGATTKC